MPRRSPDLHGSVPEDSAAALILLDVISDFEFPDAEKLLQPAASVVPNLVSLTARAREAGIPIIYVNDNFGRWRSDFRRIVDHCVTADVRGRRIAQALTPSDDDYSVLKPKHSGFYGTSLELVLRYLGAETLILTGFTTDICIAFTAADAYMREYGLWVPSDCTAANDARHHDAALSYMARVLNADIRPSTAVELSELLRVA